MQIVKYAFQQHGDERGMLVALEEYNDIPFEIKRVYYMYDTKEGVTRGYHAHKSLVRFVWITGERKRLFLLKNHMRVCMFRITCGERCMTFHRMQS